MPILIACSPSTGSSLLRRILNRHPEIFCGPETSLLAKKELYSNWKTYKDHMLSSKTDGLVNVGWHHMRGLNLQDENDLPSETIQDIARKSRTFSDFVNDYFDILLKVSNKKIWAEKTPSNAFAIGDYTNTFPQSKLIHVVRDPYDTVASLMNRGMSVYNALSVYLLNVCQCLDYSKEPFYYEVRYEELVAQPEQTVINLCSFLNVVYNREMIATDSVEKGINHMKGWNYKETGKIGSKSIGRFDKLPNETKELIQLGMLNLRTTLNCSSNSYDDIFTSLNYLKKNIKLDGKHFYFQKEMVKDKFKRLVNKSYFRSHNYPIQLIK